ncbi:hypothetical protein V3481_004011 [Fusarium oxysporum f. sp. vasinfectum]
MWDPARATDWELGVTQGGASSDFASQIRYDESQPRSDRGAVDSSPPNSPSFATTSASTDKRKRDSNSPPSSGGHYNHPVKRAKKYSPHLFVSTTEERYTERLAHMRDRLDRYKPSTTNGMWPHVVGPDVAPASQTLEYDTSGWKAIVDSMASDIND